MNEKLAVSLARLRDLQNDGRRVFESKELQRTHKERLVKTGFLRPVINGWLISTSPDADAGDTTPWYASFWEFCARYCDKRFGSDWNLSPEQSLLLHAENNVIPQQVVVYAAKGTNNTRNLLFGTSIYDLKHKKKQEPPAADVSVKNGLRIFSPAASLLKVPAQFFVRSPVEAQVALNSIKDASEVLERLLEGGHSTIASRIAGAFRRVGHPELADDIVSTMKSAGYEIREVDPFAKQATLSTLRPGTPPIVARIEALWWAARAPLLDIFPRASALPKDKSAYLSSVDNIYKSDAYHSLSIEGYRVTPLLIEHVQTGAWNPDSDEADRQSRDALAARGYWEAFQQVKKDVERIIDGANPGELTRASHREWYRALFQPLVRSALMTAGALAGYRRTPVYIKGSRHVPPNWEIVPEAMTALFNLLEQEREPTVRAVLAHWLVGYIHPFQDGNGRIARFLMNAMLASGGYPWIVVRVEDRMTYMEALEHASVDCNIEPFAQFIKKQLDISPDPSLKRQSAAKKRKRVTSRRKKVAKISK